MWTATFNFFYTWKLYPPPNPPKKVLKGLKVVLDKILLNYTFTLFLPPTKIQYFHYNKSLINISTDWYITQDQSNQYPAKHLRLFAQSPPHTSPEPPRKRKICSNTHHWPASQFDLVFCAAFISVINTSIYQEMISHHSDKSLIVTKMNHSGWICHQTYKSISDRTNIN